MDLEVNEVPPNLEPTEITVVLAIIDEFSRAKAGNLDLKVGEIQQITFRNTAVELLSKYRTKIITRTELFAEAAASGRRIYSEAISGETNVTSRSDHPTT